MATKKSKYPQDLFVIRETSGNESYLVANEKPEDVAAVGETVMVAHYCYMGMFSVSAKVETKSV